MAQINFDARQVAPDEGRLGPVPAGWYVFVATSLNLEPTKEGTGTRISGVFQVVEGPYRGRKVYHNYNWQNPSEKAQEIGHKQFSALCHATRVLDVKDTAQLLNIPFKGRVKVAPADSQYDAKNEFTAFKDINDTSVGDVGGAVAANPAPVVRPVAPPPVQQAPAGWAQPAQQAPVQQQPQVPVSSAPPAWQAPAATQPWQQAPAAQASVQAAVQPPTVTQQVAPTQPELAAPAPTQPELGAPATGGQAVPPWMQQAAQ